jgi:hypothetical protein
MTPLRPLHATRVLAESQDQYIRLTIRDDMIDGVNYMTSLWEPSPAELKTLIEGGSVRLTIMGAAHPPVMVETEVRK